VKSLNYILAGVVGAFVASFTTYRIFNPSSDGQGAPAIEIQHAAQTSSAAWRATLKRISADNENLEQQLAEMRTKLVEHDAVLTQTKQSLEELRRPMTTDMMSSALRAQLRSGEVVVTGGYKLPNGKRLYAFAQPVVEQVDGKEVVKIASRFLSVTDEVGKSVGLDTIATNAANTIQHGEVWVGDEEASVVAKLTASADTDALTSPSVTVQPGSSGLIELGDLKLKMTPVVAADHANMNFEVRLEQPQVPPSSDIPPQTQGQAAPPAGVEK
jgi:hypothetical protein